MRTADRVAFDAAMQTTRARIQEQAAVNRRLVELIRDGGFTVWTGRQLGPQLHIGNEPTREAFPEVAMHTPGIGYRVYNQAWGGWWTATLSEDGSSAFVDINVEMDPSNAVYFVERMQWWVLQPLPTAFVLVLDSIESFNAALSHFRYRNSVELDFEKIRDAGFAAVHVTEDAGRNCPPLIEWVHESTYWLRWSFAGPAEKSAPPQWIQDMAAAWSGPLWGRDPKTGRIDLGGAYAGTWVKIAQMSEETARTGVRLLQLRNHGSMAPDSHALILAACCKLLIDEMIVDHNLTGFDGRPLPVGPGLFDALGIDTALQIGNLLATIVAHETDRGHPSTRLVAPKPPPDRRNVITAQDLFRTALGRR